MLLPRFAVFALALWSGLQCSAMQQKITGSKLGTGGSKRDQVIAESTSVLQTLDVRRPREQEAVASVLKQSRLRVQRLSRGSKAWCPLLQLNTTGYPREPNPLSLALAINSAYRMKITTWDTAMSDELVAVAVGGVWWSAKQRPVSVTVITQATVDRLPQLFFQCKSWRGPLSAVLFLGLLQETVAGGLSSNSLELLKQASIAVRPNASCILHCVPSCVS